MNIASGPRRRFLFRRVGRLDAECVRKSLALFKYKSIEACVYDGAELVVTLDRDAVPADDWPAESLAIERLIDRVLATHAIQEPSR